LIEKECKIASRRGVEEARMRLGILLLGDLSIREAVTVARDAEAARLDSVHQVEAYRSGFVPLAAIAAATSRIGLGTYIANAYGRSPFLTALSALDLDEFSGGRFTLGVGVGNRHLNEQFQGIASERPHAKMRDFVEVVRRIVSARVGERVEHGGRVHSIRWRRPFPGVRPTLPVHLAAIFPRMIHTAASVADGVALGVLVSASYLRDVVRPAVREAATAAGRDPAAIAIPMGAIAAVDDDRERARDLVRRTIAGFFHPLPHPYYDFLLREQGFAKVADACAHHVPEGRIEAAIETMDDALVDGLALAGDAARCARRLREYEGLADEAILLNVSAGDTVRDRYARAFGIRALLRT
jgi:alkanesulfonate monooxygenase SsuD/methylene tetrahydromethanopterin reductase-like flavin-dependent oxidoreductase (luciferase family)